MLGIRLGRYVDSGESSSEGTYEVWVDGSECDIYINRYRWSIYNIIFNKIDDSKHTQIDKYAVSKLMAALVVLGYEV